MSVRRFVDWGEWGTPRADIERVDSDHAAGALVNRGETEFLLLGGDMAHTLGSEAQGTGKVHRRLPIDLLDVTMVDHRGVEHRVRALSHVVVRRSWRAGGFLRGPVSIICNAQYVRGLNAAPRGHPNDARFEVLEFDDRLGLRQRLQAFRRSRIGDHLPHPSISFRQATALEIGADKRLTLVDGVRQRGRRVTSIRIVPDGVIVWTEMPEPEPEDEET
jgi:hypothetical protein